MRRVLLLCLLAVTAGCPPSDSDDPAVPAAESPAVAEVVPPVVDELGDTPDEVEDVDAGASGPATSPPVAAETPPPVAAETPPLVEPEPVTEPPPSPSPSPDGGGMDLLGAVAGDTALLDVDPNAGPRTNAVTEAERLAELEARAGKAGKSTRGDPDGPVAAFVELQRINAAGRHQEALAGHTVRTQVFLLGRVLLACNRSVNANGVAVVNASRSGQRELAERLQQIFLPLFEVLKRHRLTMSAEVQDIAHWRREATDVQNKPRCYQELVEELVKAEAEMLRMRGDTPEDRSGQIGPPWLVGGRIVRTEPDGEQVHLLARSPSAEVILHAQRKGRRWIFDLDDRHYND